MFDVDLLSFSLPQLRFTPFSIFIFKLFIINNNLKIYLKKIIKNSLLSPFAISLQNIKLMQLLCKHKSILLPFFFFFFFFYSYECLLSLLLLRDSKENLKFLIENSILNYCVIIVNIFWCCCWELEKLFLYFWLNYIKCSYFQVQLSLTKKKRYILKLRF